MFKRRRQVGPQKALRSLHRQEELARGFKLAGTTGLGLGFGGHFANTPLKHFLWIPVPLFVASERINLGLLKKTIGRPSLAKRLAQKSPGLNRYYLNLIANLGVIPKSQRAPFLKAVGKLTIFRLNPFSAHNFFGRAVFDAYLETNFKKFPLFKNALELIFEDVKKAGINGIEISENLIANLAGALAGQAGRIEMALEQNGSYELYFPKNAPVSNILIKHTKNGWQIIRVDNH